MPEHPIDPLTVAEAARFLGRSTEQIRRYLREGVLPGRRLGGQWFVDRPDLEAFAQRRQRGSEPGPWLAGNDPDPLRAVIALGGSGGGNIAVGPVDYLRSLAQDEAT
jgi:excisionase family DNA binding protein